MKKYGLYAVLLLWVVITVAYLSKERQTGAVSLGGVFEDGTDDGPWQEMDTYIEAYGRWGACELTDEEKEELAKNVAGALGITSPCHIINEQSENGRITILTKESVNGQVAIKVITDEKNEVKVQYVYIKIRIYNDVDCAGSYRNLVQGVFDNMGIEGNVNVSLAGKIEGIMNLEEKNRLADELLDKLEAKVVTENRENDMFTIYAYSKGIKDYIRMGESRINVNIVIFYDEEQDVTQVYLASPVTSLDY